MHPLRDLIIYCVILVTVTTLAYIFLEQPWRLAVSCVFFGYSVSGLIWLKMKNRKKRV